MKYNKLVLVAVPAGAAVAVGTVAFAVHRYRKRRRNRHKFMAKDTRENVEALLRMQAPDFVADGLGSSLAERKITYMSDPQLVALYALTKVVKVMRARGVDLERPTKEDVERAIQEVQTLFSDGEGRKELLGKLGSIGFEVMQAVLKDGITLMAAKS